MNESGGEEFPRHPACLSSQDRCDVTYLIFAGGFINKDSGGTISLMYRLWPSVYLWSLVPTHTRSKVRVLENCGRRGVECLEG